MAERARRGLMRTIKRARERVENIPAQEGKRGMAAAGSERRRRRRMMSGRKRRKGRPRGKAEQPAPGNSPRPRKN